MRTFSASAPWRYDVHQSKLPLSYPDANIFSQRALKAQRAAVGIDLYSAHRGPLSKAGFPKDQFSAHSCSSSTERPRYEPCLQNLKVCWWYETRSKRSKPSRWRVPETGSQTELKNGRRHGKCTSSPTNAKSCTPVEWTDLQITRKRDDRFRPLP